MRRTSARGGGFAVRCRYLATTAGAIKLGFYAAPGPARRAPGADFVGVSVRPRVGITWVHNFGVRPCSGSATYPLGHYQGAGTTRMASACGPCCHQAWFCDVEPTDALTCEFQESDATSGPERLRRGSRYARGLWFNA